MSSLLEALNEVIKALSQEANDLGHYLTNTLHSCSGVGLQGICNKTQAVTLVLQPLATGKLYAQPRRGYVCICWELLRPQ